MKVVRNNRSDRNGISEHSHAMQNAAKRKPNELNRQCASYRYDEGSNSQQQTKKKYRACDSDVQWNKPQESLN